VRFFNVAERLSHINIGTGDDVTIAELASTIAKVVGYKGEVVFDASKPDGAPRKLLNVDKLQSLGWRSEVDLTSGLEATYGWFLSNQGELRVT